MTVRAILAAHLYAYLCYYNHSHLSMILTCLSLASCHYLLPDLSEYLPQPVLPPPLLMVHGFRVLSSQSYPPDGVPGSYLNHRRPFSAKKSLFECSILRELKKIEGIAILLVNRLTHACNSVYVLCMTLCE